MRRGGSREELDKEAKAMKLRRHDFGEVDEGGGLDDLDGYVNDDDSVYDDSSVHDKGNVGTVGGETKDGEKRNA